MGDKTDAWMPLWIGSYLADTMDLTRDEHGGYLLLLMAYWRNRGPLVDDDKRLRTIVKATPAEWKALRPVLAAFFTVADGVWSHKRAQAELEAADEHNATAKARAEKAAAVRWGKQSSADASGHAQAYAQAPPKALLGDMLEECPTPTPTPKEEKNRQPLTRIAVRPDDVPVQVWSDFLAIRKAKKAPLTETALAGIAKEAGRAGLTLSSALEACCKRGWQGFEAKWLEGQGKPQPADEPWIRNAL